MSTSQIYLSVRVANKLRYKIVEWSHNLWPSPRVLIKFVKFVVEVERPAGKYPIASETESNKANLWTMSLISPSNKYFSPSTILIDHLHISHNASGLEVNKQVPVM